MHPQSHQPHLTDVCLFPSPLSLLTLFNLSLFLSQSIYIYALPSLCLYWFRRLRCVSAFIFISPIFRLVSLSPFSHPLFSNHQEKVKTLCKVFLRLHFPGFLLAVVAVCVAVLLEFATGGGRCGGSAFSGFICFRFRSLWAF